MTKQDIKTWLKDRNLHDVFGYRLEVKALPQVLGVDEELYGMTSGIWKGRRWLAAVTDSTIYLISSHPAASTEVKQFSRDSVHSVSGKRGILFGKIIIELNDDDGDSDAEAEAEAEADEHIVLEHAAKKSIRGFLWAVDR